MQPENDDEPVLWDVYLYVRLNRPNTDSWITFVLPKYMNGDEFDEYVEKTMPGWEWVSACQFDPDD